MPFIRFLKVQLLNLDFSIIEVQKYTSFNISLNKIKIKLDLILNLILRKLITNYGNYKIPK